MSKTGVNIQDIFQGLLEALEINQKVKLNDFNEPNFTIQKQNESLAISFEKESKRYLFAQPNVQINQLDSNTVFSQNQRALSIVSILDYFVTKNETQSSPISTKGEFLTLCNHFMIALNSNRVYNNVSNVVWSIWNVYWSTPDRKSFCYSNCSGSCTETCAGGQCIYYFQENELNNPNLPVKERQDPNNTFNNTLFQIASIFESFVREEKNKYDNFFFSKKQQQQMPIGLGAPEQENEIMVEFLQGNQQALKSLKELYSLQRDQIRSLSILNLTKGSEPKGEAQRKVLYDFIFSLTNLISLEIQLEKGIYSTDEEVKQNNNQLSLMIYQQVSPQVINNFVSFLTQLNVEKLSLILDEVCYPTQIDLNPIISHLPSLKTKVKTLSLSINYRRMSTAQHILQSLCKIQNLQNLFLRIKTQWTYYHGTCSWISEDFDKWEIQLRQSIPNLSLLQIQ